MIRNLLLVSLTSCFVQLAYASKHVDGYKKKDGSYVASHLRSAPNKTKRDNYLSRSNINPYNGKKALKPLSIETHGKRNLGEDAFFDSEITICGEILNSLRQL